MALAADVKDSNRSEAERAMEMAEERFRSGYVMAARRLAGRAQRMCPDLPGLHQAIVAFDVHLAAEAGDKDGGGLLKWRKVLDVGPSSDVQEVRSQVKKLRLLVHPDKNPSAAANGAFHLVNEAWQALSGHLQPATNSQSTSSTAAVNGYRSSPNVSSGQVQSTNRSDGGGGPGTSSSGCRSSRASGSPSTVGRSMSAGRVPADGGEVHVFPANTCNANATPPAPSTRDHHPAGIRLNIDEDQSNGEGEDTIKDRIFRSKLSKSGAQSGASARNSSPAKGDHHHHHEAQPHGRSCAANSPPDHFTTPLNQQRFSSTTFAGNKAQADDSRRRNAQTNCSPNPSKLQPSGNVTSTINPGVHEEDGQGNYNNGSSRQATHVFSPNNVILGRACSSSFSRRQSDLPRNCSENDLRRLFTTMNTSSAWLETSQAEDRSSRQVRHNHRRNASDVPRANIIRRQASSSSFVRRECDPADDGTKTSSYAWLRRRNSSRKDQQQQQQQQLNVDSKMKKGCFNHSQSKVCIIL